MKKLEATIRYGGKEVFRVEGSLVPSGNGYLVLLKKVSSFRIRFGFSPSDNYLPSILTPVDSYVTLANLKVDFRSEEDFVAKIALKNGKSYGHTFNVTGP